MSNVSRHSSQFIQLGPRPGKIANPTNQPAKVAREAARVQGQYRRDLCCLSAAGSLPSAPNKRDETRPFTAPVETVPTSDTSRHVGNRTPRTDHRARIHVLHHDRQFCACSCYCMLCSLKLLSLQISCPLQGAQIERAYADSQDAHEYGTAFGYGAT